MSASSASKLVAAQPVSQRAPNALPWWLTALCVPAMQLALALAVASLVVLLVGENPVLTMQVMLRGALDPRTGLPSTLFYATSLIFTGLAVSVAFHAGLFNIGGEGQAYVAGLGVALACLWLDGSLNAPLMFLVAMLTAMLFGAFWAWLPGLLQAKRGAHVVVTTIMFNYIASGVLNYLLVGALKNKEGLAIETRPFAADALLPKANEWLNGQFAASGLTIGPTLLNLAFVVALLAAVVVWWLLWYTRMGHALRVFGQNPRAANYAGLSGSRIVIVTMLISGALAGLMALNEVYGGQGRLVLGYTSGMGFLGIAVALMGRNHPGGVVAAALLFGALVQGATDLQLDFPRVSPELILVIQGLVVFFAAALDRLVRDPVQNWWLKRSMMNQKVAEA